MVEKNIAHMVKSDLCREKGERERERMRWERWVDGRL